MKNTLFFIFLLSLSVTISAQSSLILNWDKHKSSIASAENLLTIHNAFYKFTDSKIKTKYWEEDSWDKKLGGIVYRFSKTVLFDNQADFLVHIHQKHVFGRGFRFREFGFKANFYNLNLLIPFGRSSGLSRRGRPTIINRRMGLHESIAIRIGGMEGAAVMSDRLRDKWLQSGEIHYRESALFLFALYDYTANMYWTSFSGEDSVTIPIHGFLKDINGLHGFEEEKDYRLTFNYLGQASSINLLNTFQFFAAFTYLNLYLIDGDKTFKYPMIRLGKTDWLPSVRFGLTPFGSEFIIENFLKTDQSLTQIRLRLGDGRLDKAYGGGLSYRRDWTPKLNVNAIVDFWIQPSMQLGGLSHFDTKEGLGGRLIAEIDYQFNKKYPIGLFTQIGYKTTGFYPGEILNKGAIARIGISLKTTE